MNVTVDPDGLVRRYSYGETLDGVFVALRRRAAGEQICDASATPLKSISTLCPRFLPTVSYVDVLRGDPRDLKMFKDKKVLIGATALELGDRFNVPNGAVIPGPVLQILAAEFDPARPRDFARPQDVTTLGGLGIIALLMLALWSRVSAGSRPSFCSAWRVRRKLGPFSCRPSCADYP